MRRALAFLLGVALGIVAAAQPIVITREAVSPERVLEWLAGSPLPSEVKSQWLNVLPRAFPQGLVDPRAALSFFEALVAVPPDVALRITQLLIPVLGQGVPVNYLLLATNKGMGIGVRRGHWDLILSELEERAKLLSATSAVLAGYSPALRAEVARILGDLVTEGKVDRSDYPSVTNLVRTELTRLRGTGAPLAAELGNFLAALSPELIAEIMGRAFGNERG
jgi:hypothetical protein